FGQRKHQLAVEFLREVDEIVADGKLAAKTAWVGGIQIIWIKRFRTTAGQAIEETVTSDSSDDNGTKSTMNRHRASIKLSEYVVDDEVRLRNVIAHEFCHLATFIINDGNGGHGMLFKSWAEKCTEAFHHRGVTVTTKHSYKIHYGYVWKCTICTVEVKRHSKSVNAERVKCRFCNS
ncbi:hypothetical protein DL98DRAFT_389527, partial [Cadophora sp. DSE1049]